MGSYNYSVSFSFPVWQVVSQMECQRAGESRVQRDFFFAARSLFNLARVEMKWQLYQACIAHQTAMMDAFWFVLFYLMYIFTPVPFQ